VLVTKVELEEVVVVAVLLDGPVEVDDEEIDDEEVDDEEVDDEEIEELVEEDVAIVVWPGKVTTPFVAYKLNCFEPPQYAVPVVDAPIEPLQTSVQA
jgi:hypothetical protein